MPWTTYKGVNVPDVTTSDAGTYLADDVRTLADRVVFTAAADPTATNDTTQGFAPGSEWLNTTSLQTWECISAATGAAVWTPVVQPSTGAVAFNGLASTAVSTGQVQIAIANAGSTGLAVEAASSQSANLQEWRNSSGTPLTVIGPTGDVGIGESSPTADLHIKAGTASPGTAPLKLTSGTLLTTPEAGAVEYDGTNFYATPSSGVREKLAFADGSNTTGLVIESPSTAGQNTIQPTATGVVPLTIEQYSTSTADLTDWKNSSGTILASISSTGTITAPLVTGLSSPSNPSDATNKSYVDASVQGLQIKPTANLATTAALPANTYNNGSSGVGATLTASANGALTVDSVAVTAGMLVLVKNESTAANNGLYVVTATGSGSAPYVLTRQVDMDTASQFAALLCRSTTRARPMPTPSGWLTPPRQ